MKLVLQRLAHVASILAPLSLIAVAQSSQPPTPGGANTGRPQQNQTAGTQGRASDDPRGTTRTPFIVQIPKTDKETAQEQSDREAKTSAEWWTRVLAGLTVAVGLGQLIVYWVQAGRLKTTIATMREIADQQGTDMQASIDQATRAAVAMEGVAVTLSESTQAVKDSLVISREIADTQKFVFQLQSRAYLAVGIEKVIEQNQFLRFEPRARLMNKGNTPAYKVKFSASADVFNGPVPADFAFPLPPIPAIGAGAEIGPQLLKIIGAVAPLQYVPNDVIAITVGVEKHLVIWGLITYEDVFHETQRFVKFAFRVFKVAENEWMSSDLDRHNESN